MNRPRWFRIIENILFRAGLASTTGIMQIKSTKSLNNEESISKAQEIVLTKYKNCKNLGEHELVGQILTTYNADAYYRSEVRDLFYRIQSITEFFEEGRFDTTRPSNQIANVSIVEELRAQAKSLLLEIDNLEKSTEKKNSEAK